MTYYEGSAPTPAGIEQIHAAGSNAAVKGFVHNIRDMGDFSFVILRTGSDVIQCVYTPDKTDFDITTLKIGDSVEVFGEAVDEPRAVNGFEIRLKRINVISSPAGEYPFTIAKRSLNLNIDTNLNYRPLTLRNPHERAIFKIQEGAVRGFSEFLRAHGFTEIHSPKIVAAGAEGGANIFELDYFGQKAYLNQSPQFYKQAMVPVFERVFEVAPVYRAEKHSTSRHLNEYIGLDFEMGFISGMGDVMNMETEMLRYLVEFIKNNYAKEISILKAELPKVGKIPSVTFMEAKDIIAAKGRKAGKWDLDPDDETILSDWAKEEHDSDFVFITQFPAAKRPFYAMDDPEDDRFALSFDLLLRGLEITTGGQRIHDYNMQVEKMRRMNLNPADFESYLMAHKYGMPPHGGLGIGLERLVMKLLNLKNVREASLFPRDISRLTP
ncbi:MAG TPA: aspartate--tRNA(Asn) ligase [Ruminiclostridium sp.]|nr:aspartate--tRNA(Asn) ligase [Ruminiclostridium sp.]